MDLVVDLDELTERQAQELLFVISKEGIEVETGVLEEIIIRREMRQMLQWFSGTISDRVQEAIIKRVLATTEIVPLYDVLQREFETVAETREIMDEEMLTIIDSMIKCIKINELDYLDRGPISVYWNDGLEDVYITFKDGSGQYLSVPVIEEMLERTGEEVIGC